MRRASTERSKPYIRPKGTLRSIAPEKETLHLPLQILQGRIEHFPAWVDDDRPPWVQPIEVEAYGFAHAPLDAVPRHSLTEGARRGEPHARPGCLRFAQAESGKQRARDSGTLVVDSSEIFRSQEADTFRKTSDGILPLGTYSEFLPAASAAARQNGAAILGFHATAKSVRLGAVTIIRLKGTFRHFSSSI